MRLIICFDDILIMGRSVEEILMRRETEIFLLQHLGFVINLQRYIMGPNKKMEFWGVKINFGGHENVPPKGENNGNTQSAQETPITEKYNPEGNFISTYQAVLPASLHYCSLRMCQITKLRAILS